MGVRQSVYEKSGTLDYVKLTSEQRAMIRNVWSDIENNPQFYGNAFFNSFLETYPRYIKFYTLEPNRALNLDARTTAKFKMIMEALGYLLLDFHSKPKQLDRLVGYIAMKHKDMHLEKQDMFNFGHSLLGYLAETFPTKMRPECREAMTNFLVNVLHEICRKMDNFREHDIANSALDTKRALRLPCGKYMIFGDGLIFGQTRIYWSEWKNHWDARLTAWMAQDSNAIEPLPVVCSSTDEEDIPAERLVDVEDDSMPALESGQPHRKVSILPQIDRTAREISASRLAVSLLNRSVSAFSSERATVADRWTNLDFQLQTLSRRLESKGSEQAESLPSTLRFEREEDNAETMRKAGLTARERYRRQSLAREAINPQPGTTVLRRRIRSSRIGIAATTGSVLSEVDNSAESGAEEEDRSRKHASSARERRRRAQGI